MVRFIFAATIGAALAYFLDPERGRDRRSMASEQIAKLLRQGSGQVSDRIENTTRYTDSPTQGGFQTAGRPLIPDDPYPNDPTLVQTVESEIFRDPDIPKGQININAENGVVVLRGQLDNPDQIRRVEESVRAIPGVEGVENLLHLPDAPAPHAV
jgi:osmotically-inducible protein OsmY